MAIKPIQAIAQKAEVLETAKDFYGKSVDVAVCVNSIFTSKGAQFVTKLLIPFRSVSMVAGLIFSCISIKDSAKDAYHAEGKIKVIPSFKVLDVLGDLFDSVSTLISFFTSKAAAVVKNLFIASTVFGVAAIALHVFGAAVNSMEVHSLRKQSRKFKALKDSDPKNALKGLRDKKGSLKFFRMLNHKQSSTVQDIYRTNDSQKIARTVKVVDKRLASAKKLQITKLVLTILAIVGMVLLLTLPTPATPILWGLLGAGSLAGIGVGIHAYFAKKRFLKKLEQIAA